ncbi:MAG: hypothetical protein ACHP78_16570 [Terriglobales bacterium]
MRRDSNGKSQFRDLRFRRGEPRFYAFDLLWVDREDLRYLPLGKAHLHSSRLTIRDQVMA